MAIPGFQWWNLQKNLYYQIIDYPHNFDSFTLQYDYKYLQCSEARKECNISFESPSHREPWLRNGIGKYVSGKKYIWSTLRTKGNG